MSVTITKKIRSDVLMYARGITTVKDSAEAVIENTAPLLAFLEGAADTADLEQRNNALHRQFATRPFAPDDDAEKFVREARVYYAYMTGGGR